ncbi:MAG: hypothetical protein U1C53_03490, partial [Candidatus Veblenbacteria bacterium]|nr:hypothetical protein [Candidatus Veblenbacteria bacterium]
MATDEQIGHIKGFIDQELRELRRNVAQLFVQNGNLVKGAFTATIRKLGNKLKSVNTVSKVIRPNPQLLYI